jgi:hypothetical protein
VVEDVVAYNIQNFGQHEPRVNSAGIEVVVGRGRNCDGVVLSDVTIRNCECVLTGIGISTRAYGRDSCLENVKATKITTHDNANTPWSYVGLFISSVRDSVYEGVCLDRCAPHWKFSGTATVHYMRSDNIVFKGSYVANTQNTDSHDMGGWDFESAGDGCVIENCTFVDNAGPAIEFLKTRRTVENVEIANSTFIGNDWSFWGDGYVVYTGRKGPEPTGSIHDNRYVLFPGTKFGGVGDFEVRDNVEYPDVGSLPPFLTPPAVDAGPDRTLTEWRTRLAGRVSNASSHRWEAIIAPGDVAFDDPEALETGVAFSEPGAYVLRLFAENGHFIYGDYITVLCASDIHDEMLAHWPFGGDARDAAGGGHHASLTGAAEIAGGSLALDGESGSAQTGPLDLGRTFSIDCRVKVPASASDSQTILANAGGTATESGLKLYVNRRGTRDGSIVLESGNGSDQDLACTRPGAFTFDEWHHLVATLDLTSQDGRGDARIDLDGSDVTWGPLIRSDLRTEARLAIGRMPEADAPRPAAVKPDTSRAAEDPVPQGFTLTFAEDFSDELSADDWLVLGAEWRAEDGRLVGTGKGEIMCRRKFPGDVLVVYDVLADADVKCNVSAHLNTFAEATNPSGYFFAFGTDRGAASRLLKRTGVVAGCETPVKPGAVHRVACLRREGTLTHFMDGHKLYDYADPWPIASGRQPHFSFYVNSDAGGRVDGVRVYTPKVDLVVAPYWLAGEIKDLRLYSRVLTAREVADAHASSD